MNRFLNEGLVIADKYRVVRFLKTGAVAQAALVRLIDSDICFVLRLSAGEDQMRLRQEAEILKGLSDVEEVAQFFDEGMFGDDYYLVTEYVSHEEYITVEEAWGQGLGEEWIVPVGRAFLQLLTRLHARDIEYYDVKLDHLFWNSAEKQLRVIDFNLCREHDGDESKAWQQRDLRETAILMAQMLQRSMNVPECNYPLPLPDGWSMPLDVQGLPQEVSFATRAVLSWLHGGFYPNAGSAVADLVVVEKELLCQGGDERGIIEEVERRRESAEGYIQQARSSIHEEKYEAAWRLLRRAWAILPFKRVGSDASDDPLAVQLFLCVQWLRHLHVDKQMAEAFHCWLEERYDAAIARLEQLVETRTNEAKAALSWLRRRRQIDDRRLASWNEINSLLAKGLHGDALRVCEEHYSEWPEDRNIAQWIDYLKSVTEQMRTYWWYEREDRPYPLIMAALYKRLNYAQDSHLLACWREDQRLHEMRLLMRRAVETVDLAWQQFSLCDFGLALSTFEYSKEMARKAIELHGRAFGRQSEKAIRAALKLASDWYDKTNELRQLEQRTRSSLINENLPEARGRYKALSEALRGELDRYLDMRSTWAHRLSLEDAREAFPQTEVGREFDIAHRLLVVIDVQQRLAERKGCLIRVFEELRRLAD